MEEGHDTASALPRSLLHPPTHLLRPGSVLLAVLHHRQHPHRLVGHESRTEYDEEHRVVRESCYGTDGALQGAQAYAKRGPATAWIAQPWPRGAAMLEVEREGAVTVANRFLNADGTEIEHVDCRDVSTVCTR